MGYLEERPVMPAYEPLGTFRVQQGSGVRVNHPELVKREDPS